MRGAADEVEGELNVKTSVKAAKKQTDQIAVVNECSAMSWIS